MGKIMDKIGSLLTNNKQKVPLLWVYFNYKKYAQDGAEGSCICSVHPDLANDATLKEMLNNLVDYVRDNYDMEKLTRL